MYQRSIRDAHDALHAAIREEELAADAVDRGHGLEEWARKREAVLLGARALVLALDAEPEASRPAGWAPVAELLAEARALAAALIGILRQGPTCLDAFSPDLSRARLPKWIGGQAETWIREA